MLERFIKFMGSRLIGPIGMLVQLSLLARWLGVQEFNQFLQFYATLVVVSSLSDGGQRNILFVALRTCSTFAEEQRHLDDAVRIKSLIAVALATIGAILLACGKIEWVPIALAMVTAIFAPPADVNLFVLRAKMQPNSESALLIFEQSILLGLLLLLRLENEVSWTAAAMTTLISGAVRSGLSRQLIICRFGFRLRLLPKLTPSNLALGRDWVLLKVAMPTTLSITAANLFNRYPVLSLQNDLPARDYAVFVAFLTLLQRGQLVIFAVQQAGFQSDFLFWRKYIASARGMVLLGLALSVPLVLFVLIAPFQLAKILVGPILAESYLYASFAAFLMLLIYPICAVQQALQLARKNLIVTIGAVVGTLVQIIAHWTLSLTGPLALLPYAVGSLIYLILCTTQLSRVPSEKL